MGNIPTERVIETLRERGAQLPALKPLDVLLRATDGCEQSIRVRRTRIKTGENCWSLYAYEAGPSLCSG